MRLAVIDRPIIGQGSIDASSLLSATRNTYEYSYLLLALGLLVFHDADQLIVH